MFSIRIARAAAGDRLALTASVLLAIAAPAAAMEHHLYAGANVTSYVAANVQPGDTVIFHQGNYARVRLTDLHGAADKWITFKGADGEAMPVFSTTSANNVWDLQRVSYIKIQGIELTGGSDGLKFTSGTTNHNVTLEGLNIHHVYNTGINASGITELHHLTVRRTEISYTGASGHGEGMYLGVNAGQAGLQVHHSLIEQNYVHHTGGIQGDGIELKQGDHSNIVQDNVVSVANLYPAITVEATYKNDPAYNNIIRRNLILNSTDNALQTKGEAVIENNIIVNSTYRALSARGRDGDDVMQDLTIRNNTVYAAGDATVHLANWNTGTGLIFANNAIYQDAAGKTALVAPHGLAAGTITGNYVYGVAPANPGLISGGTPASAFVNPSVIASVMDFYPNAGSILIGNANPAYAADDDFNGLARPGSGIEVGAYEYFTPSNPGWVLAAGFKTPGAVGLLPGDADLDRSINLSDYNALQNNFGLGNRTWMHGDFDSDGWVTVADFNLLGAHFGIAASGPTPTESEWSALAAAVPEPSTTSLLAITALALRRPRRGTCVHLWFQSHSAICGRHA